jgi:transcriptional regulator with XRE-family HTH domain
MAKPDRVEEKATQVIQQIGKRIAELRREAGWTQKEFAEILNTTVQWVSAVETGENLTVHTLVRIASKLGVDVIELWKSPGPEKRSGRGRPRKSR